MSTGCRKLTIFVCHFVAIFSPCYALCNLSSLNRAQFTASRTGPTYLAQQDDVRLKVDDGMHTRQAPESVIQKRPPIYALIVGQETVHRIAPGETAAALARKYNASLHSILRRNRILDPRRLQIGQQLIVSNRHIVPTPFDTGLVVDLPLLRLHWVQNGQLVDSFPIAAGRPAWETPSGIYRVVARRRDPTWYVPPSIQREMRAAGLPVRSRVPPGPDNPLGKYWIQLSAPGIGLHGTNAPWSVGRYATHGCIRLHDEHIERLFREVPDDTPVAIVEEPVRLARASDGRVFLEVFDRPGVWTLSRLKEVVDQSGLTPLVSWPAAAAALSGRWATATDITLTRPPQQPGSQVAPAPSNPSTQTAQ